MKTESVIVVGVIVIGGVLLLRRREEEQIRGTNGITPSPRLIEPPQPIHTQPIPIANGITPPPRLIEPRQPTTLPRPQVVGEEPLRYRYPIPPKKPGVYYPQRPSWDVPEIRGPVPLYARTPRGYKRIRE